MSDMMKVKSSPETVKTGVNDVKPVVRLLSEVLADTYRLVFKTHVYHWNVEGPLFYSVHHLTEEQYEDMFAAADDLAERIRALGQLTPVNLAAIIQQSQIEERESLPDAVTMVEDLAKDHERVAKRLHALTETAEAEKDPVTADLANARSAFHEKAAWMLRATAK